MGLRMPNPVLINQTYYLRVNVPADVVGKAKGKLVTVLVGESRVSVLVKDVVKVSLRTKDWSEAKHRFAMAYTAILDHWDALRIGSQELSHKETYGIAGAIRDAWVLATDDEPGSAGVWERAIADSERVIQGRVHPLAIPTAKTKAEALEGRFGGACGLIPIDQELHCRGGVARAFA